MAKIDTYRQLIQDIIREHSEFKSVNEDVEAQLIFDPERDRYQLVYAGWSNKRRVYGCVMQLDLKNDKIWIQHDAIS